MNNNNNNLFRTKERPKPVEVDSILYPFLYAADVLNALSFHASSRRFLKVSTDGALITGLGKLFQFRIDLCEKDFALVALCDLWRSTL